MPTEYRKLLFVQTVRECEKSLYRVAYIMLRRSSDAEDAVSAGIESAYRRLDHLREDSALPAYIMRCTVNACRDILRRRKREQTIEDFEIYIPAVHPELPIWTYLTALDEKYSLPITMRYSENMSISEIAQALRLPQGTVSTRISRGLRKLREQIER